MKLGGGVEKKISDFSFKKTHTYPTLYSLPLLPIPCYKLARDKPSFRLGTHITKQVVSWLKSSHLPCRTRHWSRKLGRNQASGSPPFSLAWNYGHGGRYSFIDEINQKYPRKILSPHWSMSSLVRNPAETSSLPRKLYYWSRPLFLFHTPAALICYLLIFVCLCVCAHAHMWVYILYLPK